MYVYCVDCCNTHFCPCYVFSCMHNYENETMFVYCYVYPCGANKQKHIIEIENICTYVFLFASPC